jgi:hypothetical protein
VSQPKKLKTSNTKKYMKLNKGQIYAAVIAATALSVGSAKAQLIDVQLGTTLGGTTDGGGTTAPSTQQTGAAVLGSAGDTWNLLNFPFASTGQYATPWTLTTVSGGTTPVTFSLFQPGNAIYGQVNPQGSATDAGTTALMQSSLESYNLGNGNYYIAQLNNMSSFAGDNFTLEVYAGAPTPQTQDIYFTSAYNGVAVTGGNTGSTLTTSSADRMLSNGPGDAYVTFTGTFVGGMAGNTVNFIVSDPGSQRGDNFNGFQLDITPAPEPSTIALVTVGGLGMLTLVRRRKA